MSKPIRVWPFEAERIASWWRVSRAGGFIDLVPSEVSAFAKLGAKMWAAARVKKTKARGR